MKERPIIFSGPMVRAILNGQKTQTRRVIKPQPEGADYWTIFRESGLRDAFYPNCEARPHRLVCPYGQPGDLLWVRETWAIAPLAIHYRADNFRSFPDEPRLQEYTSTKGWRSPLFMPRWASRISLLVTDTPPRRLHDAVEPDPEGFATIKEFAQYWDILNARRGLGWDVNPWVWVITFEVVR